MDVTMKAPPRGDARKPAEDYAYKATSRFAIMSATIGLISFFGFFSVSLLVLPIVGLILGVVALINIRRHPQELTGQPIALAGVALSALCFLGAAGMHTYIFATEVPDGYERVYFSTLQTRGELKDTPPPPAAMNLDGQRIFVKGYLHPGVQGSGPVKEFVLVPDMGTCCFGGQPKLTDMIEVKIVSDEAIEYNTRQRALAGVFKLDPNRNKAAGGLEGGYYRLECDRVIR